MLHALASPVEHVLHSAALSSLEVGGGRAIRTHAARLFLGLAPLLPFFFGLPLPRPAALEYRPQIMPMRSPLSRELRFGASAFVGQRGLRSKC